MVNFVTYVTFKKKTEKLKERIRKGASQPTRSYQMEAMSINRVCFQLLYYSCGWFSSPGWPGRKNLTRLVEIPANRAGVLS